MEEKVELFELCFKRYIKFRGRWDIKEYLDRGSIIVKLKVEMGDDR